MFHPQLKHAISLCLFGMIFIFTANAQTWTPIFTLPDGMLRYDDIYMVHESYGYVISNKAIFRTYDGFDTWEQVYSVPINLAAEYLRSVTFVNNSTGFVGSLEGNLYQTKDYGNTWSNIKDKLPESVSGICGLTHTNENTIHGVGAFFGDPKYIRSFDQGETWEVQMLGNLATSLVEVAFIDEHNGIIGGLHHLNGAVVLRTSDGGNTWQKVYESLSGQEYIWKFDIVTPALIYGSIESYSNEGVKIIKSTDGGFNWEEVVVTELNQQVQGIGFRNELHGWVSIKNHPFTLYETLDGGETWSSDLFNLMFNRVFRVNENLLYASGVKAFRFGEVPTNTHQNLGEIQKIHDFKRVYPTPFSSQLNIEISIRTATRLMLDLLDDHGRIIKSLSNEIVSPGDYQFNIESLNNLSAGKYYLFLRTNEEIKSMVIVKQ